MGAKIKPLDKQTEVFFGVHYSGYIKFLVVFNTFQYITMFAINFYDIMVVTQISRTTYFDDYLKFYLRLAGWIWCLLYLLISFVLDTLIFRTSLNPNVHILRFYRIYVYLIAIPSLTYYYTLYFIGLGTKVLPPAPTIASVLLPMHSIYRVYTCYVIGLYSRKIVFDEKLKQGYRDLTCKEIRLFENGAPLERKESFNAYQEPQFFAYNKDEFEIKLEMLDFTNSVTLGCGEYGCVYKAGLLITEEGNLKSVDVAVKTVQPELNDISKFMTLLAEAKLMTFLGKHDNVVGLIGMCTEEIRKRTLYIICELCEYGNLLSHLRCERNTFLNLFDEQARNIIPQFGKINTMSTADLVKWASEIACGMEFLSAKKIIHGDLATRNILLDATKTAKITDFGLSRRLYNYNIYQKRSDDPVPWRWLAPESLVDMNFSTASDVWGFGICCWEIFELGARPWSEFSQFTSGFVEALKNGKNPGKPKYSNDELYNLMKSCWTPNPIQRPCFTELKEQWTRILGTFRKIYTVE